MLLNIAKKLTEDEFVELTLEVNYLMLHNRKISSGLAWFTCLNTSHHLLANELKGTKYDPSDTDKNLDDFYTYIKGYNNHNS